MKDQTTYQRCLAKHGVEPRRFLMIGNSVRSDVMPVLALGGRAVHVPYHVTWAHEHVEGELPAGAFRLDRLDALPALVERLQAEAA